MSERTPPRCPPAVTPFSIRRRDCLGLMALAAAARAAETGVPQTLRVFPTGPTFEFRWAALRLALSAAPPPWNIVKVHSAGEEAITQGRVELMLRKGLIDVAGFGVTWPRIQTLRPIRVDLLKGLIGLRFLVVRREEVARLTTLSDDQIVHALHYGTQQQWADVSIMQANGMQLELASSAQRLYPMLAAGRFDALSRGANEVLTELRANAELAPRIAIEPAHALYYDYPIWLWVRRENEALARAIETGLQNVLRSGALRELFLELHKAEIEFVRRSRQRIIRLSSAALPQTLEPPDTSWWWPPGTGPQR